MLTRSICISVLAAVGALIPPGLAQPGALSGTRTDLSGVYRCEPEPSPCPWPGQTVSIAQTGMSLELKNEQGLFANGRLTSDVTLWQACANTAGPLAKM